MMPVIICEKYGWTYYEYLDQPLPFINLIAERLKIDALEAERNAKNKQ